MYVVDPPECEAETEVEAAPRTGVGRRGRIPALASERMQGSCKRRRVDEASGSSMPESDLEEKFALLCYAFVEVSDADVPSTEQLKHHSLWVRCEHQPSCESLLDATGALALIIGREQLGGFFNGATA